LLLPSKIGGKPYFYYFAPEYIQAVNQLFAEGFMLFAQMTWAGSAEMPAGPWPFDEYSFQPALSLKSIKMADKMEAPMIRLTKKKKTSDILADTYIAQHFLQISKGLKLVSQVKEICDLSSNEYLKRLGDSLNPCRYISDKIYKENYNGDFLNTPVFIGTSDPDPHVPVERVNASTGILKNMHADVTTKIYPNMGHTINKDEIDSAVAVFDEALTIADKELAN